MVAMYLFSTLTALVAAAVLGRTLFKGPRVPLILELPPYRLPQLRGVIRQMWQRSSVFLREAGGVILACTVALWLLLSFPSEPADAQGFAQQRAQVEAETSGAEREARLHELADAEQAAQLQHSYGGRMGHLIEPVIAPLGFDWKIGVGIVGAFAAREVFVSTMGVMYGVSAEVDEESLSLRERIRDEAREDGRPVYTPLVGLSLMVFFALACQCMSTLAAVYRETHSWRWPLFLLTYMTALAWVASFVVYQGGRLLGLQ
jgi:ferrous iron transport protein B